MIRAFSRPLAVLAAVAAGMVGGLAVPRVAGAADPQVPVAQVLVDRPVYDRYEPIVADGAIGFFPSCPTGGVRDFIYPWADVYIVRGASAAVGALSDVNGAPNTIAGFGGGGFFGEVLGYAGVGGLTSGTYSIVVDECQDGKFDYNDTLLPAAFRVTTKTSVAPLTGIASIKAAAQLRADEWKRRAIEWQALLLLNEVLGYASAFVTNPPMVAIGIGVSSFISQQIQGLATGIFPDPKDIVKTHNTNMARHWEGLAKDPPDPNFGQLTVVPATTVTGAVYDDQIFADAAALLAADAAEAGLVEALLHSVERYQGAAASGDGTWALVHARQAQSFATLLADQIRAAGPTLATVADSLEADPRDIDDVLHDLGQAIDDVFTNGLTAEQQAALGRSGVTRAQLATQLAKLAALDLAGFTVADAAANLRALATDGDVLAGQLDALATSLDPIVTGLVGDPNVSDEGPTADPGGPYTATAGSPAAFDAAASTAGNTPITAYAWDLDGDGQFDDATGAQPSALPGPARSGLVGVRVTDAAGRQDIAYAAIEVAPTTAPTVTAAAPAEDGPTVEIGDTLQFQLATTGAATEWFVDGVAAATGATFGYSPAAADLGVHRVRAAAAGVAGTGVARDWTVTVVGPDADGDGYSPDAPDPTRADCDDADATVYPGAPELLDTKDNDCNPASPDGGQPPAVEAGTPIAAPEGTAATLPSTARLTITGSTSPFTATVDWGDGTTDAATVATSGTARLITASHVYADDGVYPVEVCGYSGTGMVSCDQSTATISNEAAAPRFADLFGWTSEWLNTGSQGAPEWVVAPDGLSVLQTQNSDPSFFIADQPLIGTEATVTIGVESASDDDFIGFLLGIEPGDTTNSSAGYLLVDWKQGTQGDSCGTAPAGLAVSYVWGIPHAQELWAHRDCPSGTGSVTELTRASTLGATGWVDNDSYQFRFVYTSSSLQVYVDEVLQFDIDMDTLLSDGVTAVGDVVGGTFPVGNLGFYNYSQQSVRYSGYQLSAFTAQEGTPQTIVAEFDDPGTADTHIGRFDFGDGSPEEAATIAETDGAGTATTTHTYAEDGDYHAELCVTDDEGAFGCQPIDGRVANVPPVVDAGPDQAGGPAVVLDRTMFTDAGIVDTHTATVDWGDGGGPVAVAPGDVTSNLGQGRVAGSHTYAAPGTYTVEVCVTDDDGGTGCDTFTAAIAAPAAPVAETIDDVTALEGQRIDGGTAFSDVNTSEAVTVGFDWGDGTTGTAPVRQRSGHGTAAVSHTYADDGAYSTEFEVCDDSDLCATVGFTATIGNVAPDVVLGGLGTHQVGAPVALSATFGDPGTADTHTATVDWGDGRSGPASVDQHTVAAVHTYASAGTYTVATCVTDDDGGVGCATRSVVINGLAVDPPDDPPQEVPLPDGAARYVPLAPARLFDTRLTESAPGPKGRVGPNGSIDVQVAGRLNIPFEAVSVVLNVTVTDTVTPGYVTVYPAGIERPLASSINNIQPGQTRPNLVTVPLGVDGKITFFALGSVNVLADVAGYYLDTDGPVPDGRFIPLTPQRLFDTRPTEPAPGHKGKLGARESIDVQVLGVGDVPTSGVSAVVINLTGTEASAPGFLTAYPAGGALPLASNVNLSEIGTTAPNLAVVPIGADGKITIYSSHGAHALGDVTGYITDSTGVPSVEGLFVPLAPERVFDTRPTQTPPGPKGFVPARGTISAQIAGVGNIPADAVGVVLNVTGVDSPSPGYLTSWPTGLPRPLASSLNFASYPTDTRANAAMLPVGAAGQISFFTLAGSHILADATGYYVGPNGSPG